MTVKWKMDLSLEDEWQADESNIMGAVWEATPAG